MKNLKMTEQEFNDIVNDLIKFGKDLGMKCDFRKFSNNEIWCDFWYLEGKLSLIRFTSFEKDNQIYNLKIMLFPFKSGLFYFENLITRSIFLDESKLKTFNFKKYMKAYLLSYRYLKMKLEKQELAKEFE